MFTKFGQVWQKVRYILLEVKYNHSIALRKLCTAYYWFIYIISGTCIWSMYRVIRKIWYKAILQEYFVRINCINYPYPSNECLSKQVSHRGIYKKYDKLGIRPYILDRSAGNILICAYIYIYIYIYSSVNIYINMHLCKHWVLLHIYKHWLNFIYIYAFM